MNTVTIRRGETLSTLASRYGTTVAELAKANNIKDPNRIVAGEKLKVPDGFDTKPKADTQRPQKGDVFESPKQQETQAPQQTQTSQQAGNAKWKDTQTGKEYAGRDGVPVYDQGDGDWKNTNLRGTGQGGDRRIGNKGCAMSACAMAVSALSGETASRWAAAWRRSPGTGRRRRSGRSGARRMSARRSSRTRAVVSMR